MNHWNLKGKRQGTYPQRGGGASRHWLVREKHKIIVREGEKDTYKHHTWQGKSALVGSPEEVILMVSGLGPEPYSRQKGWEKRPHRERKQRTWSWRSPMGWGPSTMLELNHKSRGPEPSASQLPCLLKRRLISFDSQAGLQMRGDFSGSPVARTLPSNAGGSLVWSGS